jgi:TPP-dependent pyruvate/acetoin dehydrogenase alpha subunit
MRRSALPDPRDGTPRGVDTPVDADVLVDRFRVMARIRAFEVRVGQHFREGNIHGFVHTSVGQEAVAAGACAALRPTDLMTTTHRGHGHCLAKGADPEPMMAELFGRDTGACRGRGGSMHLAQADLGILGANGVVGAGIPIAVGAALAALSAGQGAVAIAFFGEGAVHCGAFHEGLVLAVAWKVPVIFVCENNGYAEFTQSADSWGGPEPARRAASYGLEARPVDGEDVVLVEEAVRAAVEAARAGGGPRFLEIRTHRLGGHYEGDAQPYRDQDDVEESRSRHDPVAKVRSALEQAGKADEALAVVEAAEAEMDAAVESALAAPYPDASTVLEYVGA